MLSTACLGLLDSGTWRGMPNLVLAHDSVNNGTAGKFLEPIMQHRLR